MPVIVFNKRTGKYLRRHSGSFNNKRGMMRYKSGVKELLTKKLGPCPRWYRYNSNSKYFEWQRDSTTILEDMICDAEPEDARVYTTEGSATASVGILNRGRNKKRVYALPDHLEVHEIKESFVCIMRPDGSSNCDGEEAI